MCVLLRAVCVKVSGALTVRVFTGPATARGGVWAENHVVLHPAPQLFGVPQRHPG